MPETEKQISIHIEYTGDAAKIEVKPAEVKIYHNFDNVVEDPDLPRRVRWEAHGLRKGDHVVIRPKAKLSKDIKNIFTPPDGKARFECTHDEPTTRTQRPKISRRPSTLPLSWKYDAAVVRGSRELDVHDPVVLIDKDP